MTNNLFTADSHIEFDYSNQIYTTGAYLSPLKVKDKEGNAFWVWHVTKFDNDSFKDGEIFNPKEQGVEKENLLTET